MVWRNPRPPSDGDGGSLGVEGLLREVHAPQQVLEAGVGAQGVECRVNPKPDQICGAFLVGFFQPFKGTILITQSDINPCRVGWADVTSLGEFA